MPNTTWKSTLVLGLLFVGLLGALAYEHARVQELQDWSARCDERLRIAEKAAARTAETPAPTVAAAPLTADIEELDRLRADVTEVRKQLAAVVGRAGSVTSGDSATVAVTGGATPEPFTPEGSAAIRKLIDDTLREREEARRADRVAEGQERAQERRKRTLDDMEKRLQLSAFQREQIDLALQEQAKAMMDLFAAAEAGDGAREGASREERRKKWQDLETATETKVKTVLTPAQVTEYDAWKQETGGLGGGGRGFGGRGGRGGGNDGAGAGPTAPTGGGAGS